MEWWSFNKHRYYSFLFLHCLEFFRSHKMMRKFVNFNCLMCVLFISCFGLLVHYFRSIIQFVLTPVDYLFSPNSYRIECGICLQPRLQMVTGKCQHRFCIGCMYDSKETRREGMKKCPSCQQDSAFPTVR